MTKKSNIHSANAKHVTRKIKYCNSIFYKPPAPTIHITLPKDAKCTNKKQNELGRMVLTELNDKWHENFGTEFIQTIPKIMPGSNLTPKVPRSKVKYNAGKTKRQLVT